MTLSGLAQSPPSAPTARQVYETARAEFNRSATNATLAWQLGRAAFDLAEFVEENRERNALANTGIEACRLAVALNPNEAAGHYYLALNLGQLARSKKLSALRLLHEMETAFLQADRLNPEFDFAGPDRSLGLLYLEAPPWPASVGNRKKARSHLESAVVRQPQYPENRLCLAEAFARWGESQNLDRELKVLIPLLQGDKNPFDGPAWKGAWAEWENRIRELEKTRDRLVASPRISPAERGARSVK